MSRKGRKESSSGLLAACLSKRRQRGVCNDCHGPAPSFSDKHASGDLLRGCSVSDGGPLIMSGYLLSVSAFLSISGVHLIVIVVIVVKL